MDRMELTQYMNEHMIDIQQLWNFIEALPNMPYDYAWFHGCKMRSVVPFYDEEFYEYMTIFSQCDECGEVKIGLPLMAKYLECPGRSYCSKECKKNIVGVPNPRPDEAQIGRLCCKVLTIMTMGERPDKKVITNAPTNFFLQSTHLTGNTEFVYFVVFQALMPVYIPMPPDVVRMICNSHKDHVFGKQMLAQVDELFKQQHRVVLVVPTTKTTHGKECLTFTVKSTWATLEARADDGAGI